MLGAGNIQFSVLFYPENVTDFIKHPSGHASYTTHSSAYHLFNTNQISEGLPMD